MTSASVPETKPEAETPEYLQEVFAAMQLLKRNTAARRAKSGRAEHARKLNSKPDILRKRSKTMKILWSSPEFRKKQSEGMKTHHRKHPEHKEKIGKISTEYMKAFWTDPEHRKKASETMKATWCRKKLVEKLKLTS